MKPEEYFLSLLSFLKHKEKEDLSRCLFPSTESEWIEWLNCALGQGVAPLLYYRIKQAKIEQAIPDQSLLQLRGVYYQNATRNTRLLYELRTILDILHSHYIPVVVLKGAFLAAEVYPNPALRIMSDLDILVPTSEIQIALEKLYTLSYRRTNPAWQETAYHIVLTASDRTAPLEVHTGLTKITGRHNLPIEDLWAHVPQHDFDNKAKLPGLAPEDLLIHLCHHAAIDHLFAYGIQPLCDIDEVIRKYGDSLNWDSFLARAIEWQVNRAASLTLFLCWHHLDTPIPNLAIDQLRLRSINQKIVQQAFLQLSSAHTRANSLLTVNVSAMLHEQKISGKLHIFLSNILRPPASSTVQRTSFRTRIYFALRRLLYLTGRYFGFVWRHQRMDPAATEQLERHDGLQNWLLG